ncbi:MAG: hypothetical protein MJZ42_02840 [Bacteroidales bacterium]|nr:hypothetical protein [Bacteroidales bacterium]
MDGKDNGSFWPSYVDIMTTLFAIMLVLFVVSFSRFKIKEKQLQSLVDEYENIITVYSTVSKIDSTRFFGYNEQYLKHLFTIDVEYQSQEFQINKLKLDLTNPKEANKKRDDIVEAGQLVKRTIESIENESGKTNNIKFLVVIEGQSSKVAFNGGSWQNNYTLSYLRAQYLNRFWIENGIDLSSIDKCELIIAGSGEGGVPRVIPDENSLHLTYPNQADYTKHWIAEEEKNQRFLIHIVPVIGNIDVTKEKIQNLKRQGS